MPPPPRRVFFAVLCALNSPPGALHAFSYNEHAALSAQSLRDILSEIPEARDYLGSIRLVAPSVHLCAGDGLFSPRGSSECFALGDLAALAGDHSSSPQGLLARWFIDDPRAQRSALHRLGDPPSDALPERRDDPPTLCGQSAPAVPRMLRMLLRYELGERPVDVGGFDLDAIDIDPDYICLAQHGQGHFRIPGLRPVEAARLSTPNAVASYARYHAGARALSTMSRSDEPRRDLWRALATLSESYALHFIQDAVASGHTVTWSGSSPLNVVRASHDHYNSAGIVMRVPSAVCAALPSRSEPSGARFPRLHALCAREAPRTATVRGDNSLAARDDARDPRDVTREMVELLAFASLRELLGSRAEVPTSCSEALGRCAQNSLGATEMALRCVDVWALEGCELAHALALPGALGAAEMLPEPVAASDPRGVFSDGATTLTVTTRLFVLPTSGGVEQAMVWTLGVGKAWYSPAFNGHQAAFGAELTASVSLGQNTRRALPSLPGARGWFTWAFSGANQGRPRYLGIGVSVEGMQRPAPNPEFLSGVGLGLSLVPIGLTLESTPGFSLHTHLMIDGLLPLFEGAEPAVFLGLGINAALR